MLQFLGGKPTPTTVVLPGGGGPEQHGGEWAGPVAVGAGPAGGDMRANSPGKEHVQHNHSPAHSNRNSAASSDSGRGVSTGHLEPKVVTVSSHHFLLGNILCPLPRQLARRCFGI